MSMYETGNAVPSDDPRDLSDNSKILDQLMMQHVASVLDRLDAPRKTWWQMEQDAAALVSPNVTALAAAVSAANKIFYFTGSGTGAVADFTAQARAFLAATNVAGQRTALDLPTVDVAPISSPTFTGTPAGPTPAVGTDTTQLATTAMLQAEIANKRAWTSYTPTISAGGGDVHVSDGRVWFTYGCIWHLLLPIHVHHHNERYWRKPYRVSAICCVSRFGRAADTNRRTGY